MSNAILVLGVCYCVIALFLSCDMCRLSISLIHIAVDGVVEWDVARRPGTNWASPPYIKLCRASRILLETEVSGKPRPHPAVRDSRAPTKSLKNRDRIRSRGGNHQKSHHVPYYIDILLNCLGMFNLGIISTFFTLRSYFINLEWLSSTYYIKSISLNVQIITFLDGFSFLTRKVP